MRLYFILVMYKRSMAVRKCKFMRVVVRCITMGVVEVIISGCHSRNMPERMLVVFFSFPIMVIKCLSVRENTRLMVRRCGVVLWLMVRRCGVVRRRMCRRRMHRCCMTSVCAMTRLAGVCRRGMCTSVGGHFH